jgi:hypothetical protein
MSAKATPVNVIVGMLLTAAVFPSPAFASEWGCEVLLCASSSNPPADEPADLRDEETGVRLADLP